MGMVQSGKENGPFKLMGLIDGFLRAALTIDIMAITSPTYSIPIAHLNTQWQWPCGPGLCPEHDVMQAKGDLRISDQQ
jgi:hypothetical protein